MQNKSAIVCQWHLCFLNNRRSRRSRLAHLSSTPCFNKIVLCEEVGPAARHFVCFVCFVVKNSCLFVVHNLWFGKLLRYATQESRVLRFDSARSPLQIADILLE